MTRPRWVAPATLPVLAVVLLSGCGSQALSSSQLATQATQVCQLAARQTDRIPTPSAPDGSALYLKRGLAVMVPELEQLRKLRPPDDVADVYRVSLTSFSKKLSYMRDTAHNLARGQDPVIAMRTLQQDLAPIESQENGAWQTLQITACLNR